MIVRGGATKPKAGSEGGKLVAPLHRVLLGDVLSGNAWRRFYESKCQYRALGNMIAKWLVVPLDRQSWPNSDVHPMRIVGETLVGGAV